MSGSDRPNGTEASPIPSYEWRYEYYDDEEPVSFEGLEAHRYSIVIGFWVGLAVFVMFMFFLLTLLTKTGAPHPDGGQPCDKQQRLGHVDTNIKDVARPPHPNSVESACALFQCYVSKESQVSSRALWTSTGGLGGCERRPSSGREVDECMLLQELEERVDRTHKDAVLLAHFSIPNCVGSEQSSTVGDEELLLAELELPIILEGRNQRNDFT
ncbi:hypothetical protein Q5P01_010745 [Channa striata]|uniref:Uncharacterized protein n=1 Tax=Channa striata TaxID=64152 RepID=A0AA88MRW9_CHASR|nr:hypothetical protein Q5P01_010745 [Channa striata]